jgi:glycine betaine transporter
MGVGLLFWGTAEPLTHFDLLNKYHPPSVAAGQDLFITNFHWGLHAWAIYALTDLVIAYFGFRRGCPSLIGAAIIDTFGKNRLTDSLSWLSNLLAILAIAIGVGGSIAMGVFQVKDGIDTLFGLSGTSLGLTTVIFADL